MNSKTRNFNVMFKNLTKFFVLLTAIFAFFVTPNHLVAQPDDISIEMKPRSARANMRRKQEDRLSRGVAGDAVQKALEKIKSRGEDPSPVAKAGATSPAKIKAGESGTPGLDGKGSLPKKNPRPNPAPNFAPPPPPPQSIVPQLCQQLLGLIQQLAQQDQQNQQGQQQGGQPQQQAQGQQPQQQPKPQGPSPSLQNLLNPNGNCGPTG